MKVKLEQIRQCVYLSNEFEAITLLDTLIAELDSEELVEKVARNICNSDENRVHKWDDAIKMSLLNHYIEDTRADAQAAIDTIKG